ncbi:aconitase family protein [Ancylobacter sp. MQZ15Z-1]|uniref:Aconitase family protein n=1 Tax=Ancylobacter mangrovi TaxID=2972472 RepID=A0A9X2PDD6_9HYPH|nr:aconitase family protein [Ancylobacter mangrovi]MCS0494043.1 aconitase family protein [Ancylobacter mangrovi]
MRLTGRSIVEGHAGGPVVVAPVPLSFWGGVDPQTGIVVDRYHPLHGRSLAEAILVMPGSRGSCTGSSVALQLLMNGRAPAAFVFTEEEEIVTLGVIIARRMFGVSVPVLRLAGGDMARLVDVGQAEISGDTLVTDGASAAAHHEAPARRAATALSPADRAMLRGEHGEAARFAMEVVLEMAGLYGARELIDVTRAHIDGCIYTGEASLRFAERLRDLCARVRVPTTLNAVSVDGRRWRAQGVDASLGEPAWRLAEAYLAMGARPSFTCAPYLLDAPPALGEQIVWAESNAVAYANSVLGARTMKYPDYLDICVAITGRAPLAGCHLDAGRRPAVAIEVAPISAPDDAFFALLGHHLGEMSPEAIPLVLGLEDAAMTDDDLKAFAAAFATTSGAPMFHIAGITPEARDVAAAHALAEALPKLKVSRADLAESWRRINGEEGAARIDLVALGNPHFSFTEIERLAALCAGQQKAADVALVVTCGRDVYARAQAAGLTAALERFGVSFVNDTCWCMIGEPVIPPAARTILTSSGKYAHYGPGLSGRRVVLGSLAQCVEAACTGVFDTALPGWLRA